MYLFFQEANWYRIALFEMVISLSLVVNEVLLPFPFMLVLFFLSLFHAMQYIGTFKAVRLTCANHKLQKVTCHLS